MLIRVVSLRRLSDDAARPPTAPRMLARSAKVTEPPLRILLIEGSADWLPRNRLLQRSLLAIGFPRCIRFLRHVNTPVPGHGTLPHFSCYAAQSGNSHAVRSFARGSCIFMDNKKTGQVQRTRPATRCFSFLTSFYFFD